MCFELSFWYLLFDFYLPFCCSSSTLCLALSYSLSLDLSLSFFNYFFVIPFICLYSSLDESEALTSFRNSHLLCQHLTLCIPYPPYTTYTAHTSCVSYTSYAALWNKLPFSSRKSETLAIFTT